VDGATLQSGAIVTNLSVASGATTQGLEVSYDSYETISKGGMASGTVVNDVGNENILSGAVANGTVVNSGGVEVVSYGAIANNTVVNSGGNVVISGSVVYSNRSYFFSAGTLSGGSVASGGEITGLYLSTGHYIADQKSIIDGVSVQSGAILTDLNVDSGTSTQGLVVSNGGYETISAGGIASATVINNGAENIDSGAYAVGTVINSGGYDSVNSGGTASGTVINYGGHEYIQGNTINTVVNNGGMESVSYVAVVNGTVVNSGGEVSVAYGGAAVNGMVVNNGGYALISGGIVSGCSVASGGELIIENSSVNISGLVLNGGAMLDFMRMTVTSVAVNSTNQLLITDAGTVLASLALTGNYSQDTFSLTSDGFSDTLVTVNAPAQPSLTAVSYNAATGVFTLTGAHLDNGIALADLILTAGTGSYHFNATTGSVSNLTAGGFNITISSADHSTLNALINNNGMQSLAGTAYKLTAAANWDSGVGAAIAGQSVTVSGLDIFNSKPGGTPLTISNLVEGYGQIELSKSIFTAFAGDTSVKAANFSNAVGATSATDYLYYNSHNGGLYYDAAGSSSHGNSMEIAVIGVSSHPAALGVVDFKLIA